MDYYFRSTSGYEDAYYGDGAPYYEETDDDLSAIEESWYPEDAAYYWEEDDEPLQWSEEAEFPEETEVVDYAAGTYASIPSAPFGETTGLAESLRGMLDESYETASPEEIQEALYHIVGSMTPAESFDFGKALGQIGRAGQQVLKDPTVSQIAGTVLPAAGATIGTIYGGPMGGAIGGQIGQTAAGAFKGSRPAPKPAPQASQPVAPPPLPVPQPAAPHPPTPVPQPAAPHPPIPAPPAPSAAGSSAAMRLFQVTQNQDVLASLLAAIVGSQRGTALPAGQSGAQVPVADVMKMIASLAGRAAEEVEGYYGEPLPAESFGEPYGAAHSSFTDEHADALYDTLMAQPHFSNQEEEEGYERI